MRQDLRLHILQKQISDLQTDRGDLQRELTERGRGVAERLQFGQILPQAREQGLTSASAKQILTLTMEPQPAESRRTWPQNVLAKLSQMGEVRAANVRVGEGRPADGEALTDRDSALPSARNLESSYPAGRIR